MYRWSLLIPELWPPDDWAEAPDVGRCRSRWPSVSARSQRRSDKTEPTPCRPGSTGNKEEPAVLFCCLDKLKEFKFDKKLCRGAPQSLLKNLIAWFTHADVSVVDQHTESRQDLGRENAKGVILRKRVTKRFQQIHLGGEVSRGVFGFIAFLKKTIYRFRQKLGCLLIFLFINKATSC